MVSTARSATRALRPFLLTLALSAAASAFLLRPLKPRPASSISWRGVFSSDTRNINNHHKASSPFALHAAAPAASAAAPGGDENDGEASEGDESDEASPAATGTPPNWQAMGMTEPPPPPTKHATQVDLTGVPDRVMNSVFKLKVISCPPLFRRPWARQPTSTSFSTAWAYDVKEKLLLTNSHCVTDGVVINVKKPGNSALFKAEVLGRNDASDLALLRVPDEAFWEGVEAIRMEPEDVKLGELVTVIGYPRGGEKICLTKGIVSRLHFNGEYLAIQIDAAINPGNSGGPVLNEKGDCIGIAYRKRVDRGSENIGYIIPVAVVKHFLEDYRRHGGEHMGTCLQGFELQDLTNEALRESAAGNHTGCLVIDVAGWTNAAKHLKKDDVVLSIDGHKMQNDKTVPFKDNDFIPYEYLTSYHFVGDHIQMDVLRKETDADGKPLEPPVFKQLNLTWEMQKRHPILPSRPNTQDFLMVGGLLFLPLSWEIYDPERATRALRSFCECVRRQHADEEVVVLSEIFPHAINDGYLPPRLTRVLAFNDEPVRNLAHLTRMMEEFEGNWMKVAVDSNLQQTILLDNRNNAVWDATREIILTYSVPYYKTPLPPAAVPEGAEAARAEIPPWMRKRAAEAAKTC